ncbi:MAG: ADP-ribosylglycohydrolase family protein [Bacteroidaceae bacterium]|nr:ADP-ribosylglycohydrolase family protein [Bacteroidaceae bacterium]
MIGCITGDIVGSVYEFANIKTKKFPLFDERCCFTDDTVLTIATADWLLHGGDIADYYTDYGVRYPASYGKHFFLWLSRAHCKTDKMPYYSCGNGSGMRVGPVGWAAISEMEALDKATQTAICTHNHPEGIRGAQAIALAVWMARNERSKEVIRRAMTHTIGYDLNFTIDAIRPTYTWGALCQDSVPQAIVCFLESTSFEDALRNAVSIGGDSDTLACMAGAIAEAYYGVPKEIREKTLSFIPDEFIRVIDEFEEKYS